MMALSYPPPTALAGGLPVDEAIPWLLCLHEAVISRLGNFEGPLMARAIRRFGDDGVGLLLFEALADVYGISSTDLLDGFMLNRSDQLPIDHNLQPKTKDGFMDSDLLIPESDEILRKLSTGQSAKILDGYAMGRDPCAPLMRSHIAIGHWGIAWVNVVRPHHHEEIAFDRVQSIHQSWPKQNAWSVILDDWKLRLFHPPDRDVEDFIRAWRETVPRVSSEAGLQWKGHFSGYRQS